jgi:putative oligomerization/nucleic acid binding protein
MMNTPEHGGSRMTDDDTTPLDDRLAKLGVAGSVHRFVVSGIGKLPVADATKASLTSQSATVVVTVAETGMALAKGAAEAGKGAASAAKDGADAYQRTRRDQASGGVPPTVVDVEVSAEPEPDITERLERLSRLHADGHLDDAEYQAAKAQALAGG